MPGCSCGETRVEEGNTPIRKSFVPHSANESFGTSQGHPFAGRGDLIFLTHYIQVIESGWMMRSLNLL